MLERSGEPEAKTALTILYVGDSHTYGAPLPEPWNGQFPRTGDSASIRPWSSYHPVSVVRKTPSELRIHGIAPGDISTPILFRIGGDNKEEVASPLFELEAIKATI